MKSPISPGPPITLRFASIRRWFLFGAALFLVSRVSCLSIANGIFNPEYLIMLPVVLGALAMWLHQSRTVVVDDDRITSSGPFGRRSDIAWRDVQRVQMSGSGSLVFEDGRGTAVF